MKKIYFSLAAMMITGLASAQLSIGVNSNYTMYKGEFQKSTPGAAIRVGYGVNERSAAVFSFTYGMPIKEASLVTLMDNSGNSQTVESEIKYNFKTVGFNGNYNFIGDDETAGTLYGIAGGSFVHVSYKETVKAKYDANVWQPMDQIEKESENGFTVNLGLGGSYNVGAVAVFGEAAIALPANRVGNTYVENVIPTHLSFNLGIKLPLGGR